MPYDVYLTFFYLYCVVWIVFIVNLRLSISPCLPSLSLAFLLNIIIITINLMSINSSVYANDTLEPFKSAATRLFLTFVPNNNWIGNVYSISLLSGTLVYKYAVRVFYLHGFRINIIQNNNNLYLTDKTDVVNVFIPSDGALNKRDFAMTIMNVFHPTKAQV